MRKVFTATAFIVAIAILLTSTGPASAKQQSESNVSPEKGERSENMSAVRDLATAAQLAAYGERAKDPLSLIAAAQIMKNTPVRDEQQTKTSGNVGAKEKKTAKQAPSAEVLLAEAKAMTQDPALLELADKVARSEGSRGRFEGPARHADNVPPRATDTYEVTFKGGQVAEVAILGDGDNDLDLFVYDVHDNLIAKDTDNSDKCYVSWTPKRRDVFKIHIKNPGSTISSNYILLTN